MDPVTRYQAALDELADAAFALLHPRIYRRIAANELMVLAAAADVAPPGAVDYPETCGDELVDHVREGGFLRGTVEYPLMP